jgi:hypothetical protein
LSRFSNCAACTSSGCTRCAFGNWLDETTGTCVGMGLARHFNKVPWSCPMAMRSSPSCRLKRVFQRDGLFTLLQHAPRAGLAYTRGSPARPEATGCAGRAQISAALARRATQRGAVRRSRARFSSTVKELPQVWPDMGS